MPQPHHSTQFHLNEVGSELYIIHRRILPFICSRWLSNAWSWETCAETYPSVHWVRGVIQPRQAADVLNAHSHTHKFWVSRLWAVGETGAPSGKPVADTGRTCKVYHEWPDFKARTFLWGALTSDRTPFCCMLYFVVFLWQAGWKLTIWERENNETTFKKSMHVEYTGSLLTQHLPL